MAHEIRPMTIDDYPEVWDLWKSCEGVVLGEADRRADIQHYLAANPGLSAVARIDGRLVGAVLCSQDGRVGMLRHLAVRRENRQQGLGRALVDACLAKLAARSIRRCIIHVVAANQSGIDFWNRLGWKAWPQYLYLARDIESSPRAE